MSDQVMIEIREAIERSLPEQMGAVLKERLQTAQEDAASVKRLCREIDGLREEVKSLRAENIQLNKQVEDTKALRTDLDAREETIRERELNDMVRQVRLELSEARRTDLFDLLQIVFKSPVYRRSLTENANVPDMNHNAYPGQKTATDKSVYETVVEE